MADLPKLQKAIAHSGLMSRRAAEDLIAAGRVHVDGRRARTGERVDPAAQRVTVDGKPIPVNPELVTYLVYKPMGVISTADDPHNRRSVVDLIPSEVRLYPVGRLDADSEGLILVTNDGTLTDLVMHPRYGITKKYLVMVEARPGEWIERLCGEIQLDDGPARARSVRLIDSSGGRSLVEMVMEEGRNREIRRMVEAVGQRVISLVRTAIGPLSDRQLEPGGFRRLAPDELAELYAAADTDP